MRISPEVLRRESFYLPKDTYPSWLQHHRKRKIHGIVQPPFDECPETMPMSNDNDIGRIFSTHVRLLYFMNLLDEAVKTIHDLLWRSTTF
jgi:hypothetical protein